MTHAATSSDDLRTRLQMMSHGAAHRELANQVIALAQERGDEALEFDVRQRLVEDGVMTGATDLALANFAWCAAKYDEQPAWFADGSGGREFDFFWQHKWMPGQLCSSPAFTREHISSILDEMEARFEKAADGMSAVVTSRFETALALGDVAQARRFGDQLAQMDRDDLSSCNACVPGSYVELALAEGDDAKAVDIALTTWRDGQECTTEPGGTLANLLVTLLRCGQTDDAVEAFGAIREQLNQERDQVRAFAKCAQFASLTGNHDAALALVERHLGWLATDALDDWAHLDAAQAFAVALERAADAHPEATLLVRASTEPGLERFLGKVEQPLTARELADRLWSLAQSLAGQFDERNGNSRMTEGLARSRALVAEEYPVDLGEETIFAPIPLDSPQPHTYVEWLVRAFTGRMVHDLPTVVSAAAKVLDLADNARDGLLAQWSAHHLTFSSARFSQDDAAAESAFHAWREFARREFGEPVERLVEAVANRTSPEQMVAAALECAQAPEVIRADALVAAIAAHRNSEPQPTAEGAAWRADVRGQALGLLNQVSAQSSEVEHIQATVVATGARLMEHGDALAAHQDPEAALAAVENIDAGSRPGLSEAVAASIASARGQVANATEDFATAAAEHEQAARLYAQAGLTRGSRGEAINAAHQYLTVGDSESGVARLDYALSLYAPDEEVPLPVRWMHAQGLVVSGEGDRAIPTLTGIVAEEQSQDAPAGALAQTHRELARAYSQADDERAIEHFGVAAQLYAQAEMWTEAADAALMHYRQLSYFRKGIPEQLAVVDQAHEYAAKSGEPVLVVRAVLSRMDVLALAEDPSWQAQGDSALELARSMGDLDVEIDVLWRVAEYHLDYGDKSVGIDVLKQRIDVVRRTGDMGRYLDAVMDTVYEAIDADLRDQAVGVIQSVWAERATLPEDVVTDIVELSDDVLDYRPA